MEQRPITLNGIDLCFSSREELVRHAFELYGDILSADEILDRTNQIWEKFRGCGSSVCKTCY